MKSEIKVWRLDVKIYILKDIPLSYIQYKGAEFLDSLLSKENEWREFHEINRYKQYCMSGLFPLEKDGMYKKDKIYTLTVRTVDSTLAKYFAEELKNHYTDTIKGLTSEISIIPRKIVGELYSLTPVILKSDQGYWKNTMNITQFEKRLFENIIKKYNQYTGKKADENFQLYTNITFLNQKPIANEYKGIRLLGDKIHLQVADNEMAQEMAYFMLGAGMLEMNSRGYGFCNFRWI